MTEGSGIDREYSALLWLLKLNKSVGFLWLVGPMKTLLFGHGKRTASTLLDQLIT